MSLQSKKVVPHRIGWQNTVCLLVVIAFLVPLVVYGWGGTFMRYSGDDYCYGQALVVHGFAGSPVYSYFHSMPFNGNRYAMTLLSNIGDLFGSVSGSVMPGLAIILWVAGTFLLLRELTNLLQMKVRWLILFMLAEYLTFICLYQAPLLLQDLFWRTAMLTYLAPVISLTWLLWLLVKFIGNAGYNPTGLVVIGMFAFVSAGFSETGAALQAAILILGFSGVFLTRKMATWYRHQALKSIGVALFISLLALTILASSPSNADRIGDYSHADSIHLVTLSFSFALVFILESLKSYPLPTVVTLVFSSVVAMGFISQEFFVKIDSKKWLVAICLVGVVTFTLVAASASPSALARSAYPELRAWMPGRFVMTSGLVALGVLFGALIQQMKWLTTSTRQVIVLALLLMTGAYTLRTAPRIMTTIQPYRDWAAGWDTRDKSIRSAIASGEKDLQVSSLPMIIPFVSELKPDPDYWYNECAAGWYGVDTISADLFQP